VFNISARKQWVGLLGAPSTVFASATTYLEDYQSQIGIMAIQDKIGYTSTIDINFTYAYALIFRSDWQVHFGLGGSFQKQSYDLSKLNVVDETDSHIYEQLVTNNDINADLGFEITNRYLKFGLSSKNILSIIPKEYIQKPNTNYMYVRYRDFSDNAANIGLGICGIQNANIYQAEFNITSYFKAPNYAGRQNTPDLFDLGLYYRTGGELVFIMGFEISDDLHISYSYDYHFGGIRLSSYGTNEIMFTYNLNKNASCKNCWY
jgi:type IX secretion system PorP/SprF family membrane protein